MWKALIKQVETVRDRVALGWFLIVLVCGPILAVGLSVAAIISALRS